MPSRKYPVLDASSAITDYNKKVQGFGEIQNRIKKYDNNLAPLDINGQPTLDQHLMTQGIPAAFSTKYALAKSMGLSNYDGSAKHDQMLLGAIGTKQTNDGDAEKTKNEQANKDREYQYKDKELALKEKEIEAKKMPGAPEIADQLMSKFKTQE